MKRPESVELISAALYHHSGLDDRWMLDELRTTARAHNVRVVLEVDDTGCAGRPGLVRVLQAATAGQVAVVFVLRLDHLGDSASAVLETVRVLRDARCRLVVTSQELDVRVEGELSNALVAMLRAVGELDLKVTRRRARRRLESARRVGKKPGRPPKADAPDGARVRELRAQHWSWGQIAQRLHCTREAARRAFARTS